MIAFASLIEYGVSDARTFSALPSEVLYIFSQSTILAVMPGLTCSSEAMSWMGRVRVVGAQRDDLVVGLALIDELER